METSTRKTKTNKLVEKLTHLQQTLEPLISFDDIDPKQKTIEIARRTETNVLEVSSSINVVCSYAEITSLFYTYRHSSHYQNMQSFFKHDCITGQIPNFVEEKHILIRRLTFTDNDSKYQWQYAESYAANRGDTLLTITIYTLSDPLVTNRRNTITDIVAIYLIREISDIAHANGDKAYNIMFTGKLSKVKENGNKPSISHLSKLANDIKIIPEIILKRRILSQQQVNLKKYRPDNNLCTNCLSSLIGNRLKYLFTDPKVICCLCGYNICKSCVIEKSYSPSLHGHSMMICKNCLARVQYCNFSNIDQESDFNSVIEDQVDYDAGSNAFEYIMSNFQNDKRSYRYIISKMLNKDMTLFQSTDKRNWTQELCQYLTDHPPLDKCIISTINDDKSYPLRIVLSDDIEGFSPLPTNEKQRLAAANTININKWSHNPELLKICDIVAYDQCDITMLIIVGSETELNVLASNNPAVIARHPRRLSFCQYILMEGVPILISNPESDIRFCRLKCLKEYMIRFYFGVPVFHNGHIVGTLCLMSSIFRHISRTQYSLMTKLAQTVSNIFADSQSGI